MPSKFILNRLSRKRCLANNNKKQAEDCRVLGYRPLILLSVSLSKKSKSCHQIINHTGRLATGTVLQLKKKLLGYFILKSILELP